MKYINKLFLAVFSFVLFVGVAPINAQGKLDVDSTLLNLIQGDSEREYTYYFLEGIRLKHKGEKDAAFDLFKHCIQLDPSKGTSHYELGALYMDMNQSDKALASFEKAVGCDSTNYWFNEALFFSLYSDPERADDAVAQLETMTIRFPNKSNLQFQLLELYSQLQQYEEMIVILNRLEKRLGKSEQLSMEKFRVYLYMNEETKAFDEIKDLVDTYPKDLRYQVVLGNLYLKNDKKKQAYKVFRKVLKKDPENAMAIYALANYYNETNQPEKYSEQLRKVVLNAQSDSELKLNLLRQLIAQSEDEEYVQSIFEEVIKADPADDDVPMLYAQYLLSLDKEEEAMPVLEHILSIDPTNTASRLILLSLAIRIEDYKKVITVCEAGVLASPSTIEFYYYLAIAYNQEDNWDDVLKTVNQALQVVDDSTPKELISDFYAIMGDVYHAKKEKEKLYASYDKALSYHSSNLGVLNNYAYYLSVDRQDLTKAKEMSKKTVDAEPKNSTFLDTYAWVLFELGEYPQAKVYIETALENGGDKSGVIVEHAGDIYYKLGDKDKAIEFWTQADALGDGSDKLKIKLERKKYVAK